MFAPPRFRFAFLLLPFVAFAALPAAHAQRGGAEVEVVATDLANPIGVAVDAEGRVWVAETGTGNNDGRVSVVLPDGAVHPFLTGMPSVSNNDEPDGITHLLFYDGMLWIAGGAGATPKADLFRYDPTGFTPGDPPLGLNDFDAAYPLGVYVLDQGFLETNVYGIAEAGGTLYLTDAAANSVLTFAPDIEEAAVLTTFDPVETGGTPPVADPVPTGLAVPEVTAQGGVLVSSLTGFPFADGAAHVYTVAPDGTHSIYREDLTLLTDIAIDPRDGLPVVLQFAEFQIPDGFLPGTGRVLKLRDDGSTDVIADGLNLTPGMAFADDGTLYVTSLFGQLLRVSFPAVAAEPDDAGLPDDLVLHAPAPNPSAAAITLRYELARPAAVRLVVYDALGREVAVLADGAHAAGPHTARFDGAGLPSGVYLCRLTSGNRSVLRHVTVLR
ncbi:MAG: ScyD/ScyE family protein [Rhodothermales bacterium]|nr:ScyD/ScyE family protein [Rhodothermales bacterium]